MTILTEIRKAHELIPENAKIISIDLKWKMLLARDREIVVRIVRCPCEIGHFGTQTHTYGRRGRSKNN